MSNTRNECNFCEIVTDKNQKVFTGKYVKILQARTPLAEMHLLFMPLRHTESVDMMTVKEIQEIFELIKKIARNLITEKSIVGYNIFVNNGKKAGQQISHVHFHFIGRNIGESISPFKILNSKKLYDLKKISNEELSKKVKKMRTKMMVIFKKGT